MNEYCSRTSEPDDGDLQVYTDMEIPARNNVVHAIIIPNYKEAADTLRETLEVLASHHQAQNAFDASILHSILLLA